MSDQANTPPEVVESGITVPEMHGSLPGPGFLAAVGWVVVFFLLQAVLILPIFFRDAGGVFPALLTGLSGLFAALLIVRLNLRRDSWRVLAVRELSLPHAVCLLALAPVLAIVRDWNGSLLEAAYRVGGLTDTWLDPLPFFGEFVDAAEKLPAMLMWPVVLISGAVLPAVWEEVYFRGFLGRGLLARWGVVGGVALTSILFGAIHPDPIQSVQAAIMGGVLHVVYLWSRSLFAPILLHAANNSLVLGSGLLAGNSPLPEITEAQHPEWPLVLASWLGLAGVSWLYYSMRARWIMPDGLTWPPGYISAESPPAGLGAKLVCSRASGGPLAAAGVSYAFFLGVLAWYSSW